MAACLVLGLGVTGEAVVRHRAPSATTCSWSRTGPRARTRTANACATARRGRGRGRRAARAGGARRAVRAADIVVPSPGVPRGPPGVRRRRATSASTCGPRWSSRPSGPRPAGRSLVGVTGTNGKTTVTTLITAMLDDSGIERGRGGEHRAPAARRGRDRRRRRGRGAVVVPAQLHAEALPPEGRPLLNLAHDHLDWHGSFDGTRTPRRGSSRTSATDDLLVLNADDAEVARAWPPPRRRDTCRVLDRRRGPAWSERAAACSSTPTGMPFADVDDLPVSAARHDRANALAAAAAAIDVGATRERVERALREFPRLPHRVARIGEEWWRAVLRRLEGHEPARDPRRGRGVRRDDGKVVLIAGGLNKDLDLSVLRPLAPRPARRRRDRRIRNRGGAHVRGLGRRSCRPHRCGEAVAAAAGQARPGDVVLLSPACASFDWYGATRSAATISPVRWSA